MKEIEIHDSANFEYMKALLDLDNHTTVIKARWVFPTSEKDVNDINQKLKNEGCEWQPSIYIGEWNIVVFYSFESNSISWRGQHGCISYTKKDIEAMIDAVKTLIPNDAPLDVLVKRLSNDSKN